MPSSPIKVLIADDHALVREGMVSLLGRFENVGTISEAADGKTALSILLSVSVDIAILDIRLPGLTGVDVAREVRTRGIKTQLMLMTGEMGEQLAMTVIQELSLDAFLYKSNDMRQFETAIKSLLNGKSFFPENLIGGHNSEDGDASPLSKREEQVVKLIAEGHTSETSAHLLGISPHTVRKHRENIKRKLGLGTVAELSSYAVRNQIL